jgi:hypothetical protein
MPGQFHLASFRAKLGAADPKVVSLDITGRGALQCDRLQAFLTVEPSAAGAMPTLAEIQAVERLVRVRIALDRNDRTVINIGDQPVSCLQQLQQGPVPVQPFLVRGSEQPTVRLDYPPNLLQNAVFTAYGPVHLEIVFWGVEA